MDKATTSSLAEFSEVYTTEFVTVSYNKSLQTLICSATREYIPIDIFKATFSFISSLLETNPAHTLIFDKRKLNTFHQPSMEWYFAVWKQEVKQKGLVKHYKILPELDWFKKAVEAGKADIHKKYGDAILNGVSVNYINSLEEGIHIP